jgi:hypothetical protein
MSTQPKHGWLPQGTFIERLFLVRAHMGWNRKEAALASGIPYATWRTWEVGGSMPSDLDATCRKIAHASGCDYVWLMTGHVSERPGPDGLSASRCIQPFGPTPALELVTLAA